MELGSTDTHFILVGTFFLVFPRLFTLGAALLIVIAVWLSDMPCSEILNYTARKVLLEDRQAE